MKISKRIQKRKPEKRLPMGIHFATVQTNLLIRSDRINQRIYNYSKSIQNYNKSKGIKTITNEELDNIMKTIQTIVSEQLSLRGGIKNG